MQLSGPHQHSWEPTDTDWMQLEISFHQRNFRLEKLTDCRCKRFENDFHCTTFYHKQIEMKENRMQINFVAAWNGVE